jgi:anaerobic C4-dicarboxylate transporter DcuA
MIWLQLLLLLTAILIGSRMKGIGLGIMGMVGVTIFVFIFRMKPGEPPVDVLLIILSVVTTAATLQAAGGMDYLVELAARILRSRPALITLLGPLVTYAFTVFAGTSHINYSLLPIIAEVSTRQGIRPERPLSISVIAAHLGITASPVAAATATMLTLKTIPALRMTDILMVCIPSTIIGTLAGVAVAWSMGKDLVDDKAYQQRLQNGEIERIEEKHFVIKPGAKLSVIIFALGFLTIVLAGAVPSILPSFPASAENFAVDAKGHMKMAAVIQFMMLTVAAAILIFTKTTTAAVAKASLFNSGAQAVVSVFGVVWMSATFMSNHAAEIEQALGSMARQYNWTFAIALFLLSALLFSQAATVKALMPLGVLLGIPGPALIAMFPAVNGDFVLPGYPTLLAAVQFDRTGTTHFGKYVLNHSFMLPGLVAVAASVAAGFALSTILL